MTVRDLTTTLLDVLGLLLVAAGLAAAAWTLVGPAALLLAGLVVLAGSWWASVGEARLAVRLLTRADGQVERPRHARTLEVLDGADAP